jgi:hypothetical protein
MARFLYTSCSLLKKAKQHEKNIRHPALYDTRTEGICPTAASSALAAASTAPTVPTSSSGPSTSPPSAWVLSRTWPLPSASLSSWQAFASAASAASLMDSNGISVYYQLFKFWKTVFVV